MCKGCCVSGLCCTARWHSDSHVLVTHQHGPRVAPQLSPEREPEREGWVRDSLQQVPQLDGQLCKIALGICVRGIEKQICQMGVCIWRLLVKGKILNFTELST